MIDFNDPEQRLDYLLHHGVDAYNKAMEGSLRQDGGGDRQRPSHPLGAHHALRRALHGRRPQPRPPDPGRRPPDRAR